MKAARIKTLVLIICITGTAYAGDPFHFTVTADMRSSHTAYGTVLQAINNNVGGPGVFHVTAGDFDPPDQNRLKIDAAFGTSALWYPIVGNHEVETAGDMTWVRNEYNNGNGVRTPLKNSTNQDGPPGTVETTYSWDYGNAHFISLNEYWNGGTAPGSDTATDGDIVTGLYNWLSADLAANTRPFVFVLGHEPAFPFVRHVNDSLDKYTAHRDAFWNLLESYNVAAFFCGHTHYYSSYQHAGGSVWQVDCGNAGADPGDGLTFLDVFVNDEFVRFDVYRNASGQWAKTYSWVRPVPEPATATLLAFGALVAIRRKRKRPSHR